MLISYPIIVEQGALTILKSETATQEISPIEKLELVRNINSEVINNSVVAPKYYCKITTSDPIKFEDLKIGETYKIYFVAYANKTAFDMFLINFKCKYDSNGLFSCDLEFSM